MKLDAVIAELRARLELAQGSPTLLLAVGQTDAELAETHRLLFEILRATPLEIVDLGACKHDLGPARWTELTTTPGAAYMLHFTATTPFAALSFARLLNAERQWLQRLAGPVVLVVSRGTEKLLRQHAQDFVTWLTSYELPGLDELGAGAARLGVAAASLKPSSPPEAPLRFLHISDLHLRPQAERRYDQDRVLTGLLSLLERERENFPLDLIFVTGDLAHAGKPEEYRQVAALLQRLMTATGVASEALFVVPGNHDVDRGVGKWLLRSLSGDEEAVQFFVEPSSRTFHRQKFAAYTDGLGPSLGPTRALGLGVGVDAVEVVEVRGRRVAIASFNSAWFAQDDADHGKLWLGEANVARALDKIADADVSMAIALMHHPFEDLHPDDRALVEPLIERGFDVVLRGHLHANSTRSILSQRGGFVELAAPAAYQGSKWHNGGFFGELRTQARTVKVKPYTFGSLADPWVLDTKVFPEDEQDGYCRTFVVPAKQRPRALLRAATAEAIRNAPAMVRRDLTDDLDNVGQKKLPEDAAVQRAGRLLAESPEVWRGIVGKDSPELALMNGIFHQGSLRSRARISIRGLDSFEAAMREASQMFLDQISLQRMHRSQLSDSNVVLAFAVALEVVVDTGTTIEANLPMQLLPHIVMSLDHSARCVIEFKRATYSQLSVREATTLGLKRLDHAWSTAVAHYGALVLVGATLRRELRIERGYSPEGNEVLVVHL